MLLVRDSRTIEVKWREPLQSNGIIERYVLDWTENRHEFRNFTILKTVLSYLTPFTEYHISVIACTGVTAAFHSYYIVGFVWNNGSVYLLLLLVIYY